MLLGKVTDHAPGYGFHRRVSVDLTGLRENFGACLSSEGAGNFYCGISVR